MPCQIKLDEYRESIEDWILQGLRHQEVIERLEQDGARISLATLKRRLCEWGIQAADRTTRDTARLAALKSRIKFISGRLQTPDEQAARLLSQEGHQVGGPRSVQRIRKQLGLYRRFRDVRHKDETTARLRGLLAHDLDQGHIESFGRANLRHHAIREYGISNRALIYQVAAELNPDGIRQRQKRHKARRGAVIVPGPNFAWSMDGHCKLELFGIQIYGAIDVYARFITWMYVGITGRTATSVLCQYVKTLAATGVMPQRLRTDRGGETLRVSGAHHYLRCHSRESNDQSPLSFTDVFKYGTSKQNQRIESWWNLLAQGCLNRWRDYFLRLVQDHDYNPDLPADRIAFLAVYVPIIRQEVMAFVEHWNTHPIRKQSNWPHVKHGAPYALYHYPEEQGDEQCGINVNATALQPIRDDIANFDLDEYIPPATKEWCNKTLSDCGFDPITLNGRQSDVDGNRLHEPAYKALRDAARHHIQSQEPPYLMQSAIPYAETSNDNRWMSATYEPSPELRRLFHEAGVSL